MKKFFTLSLLLIYFIVSGQTRNKKADELFEDMRYKDAAKEYETAFKDGDKSLELVQQAGDAYYFNSDMINAVKWYDVLFAQHKIDSIESRYVFRYIHALKGAGKYKKWKSKIDFFADNDIITPAQVAQLNKNKKSQLDELIAMEPSFKVFLETDINSKYSDFGPMFYKNEVVFASARDTMDLHTREYHWNKQSFLDLYIARPNKLDQKLNINNGLQQAEIQDLLKLDNLCEFSKAINTRYHEASVSFSPNEKVIYFTRNNYKEDEEGKLKRGEDGINHLKMYRARYVEEKKAIKRDRDSIWSYIEELPFNNESYSVGHPAVSNDGKTLYFVSDMPGGMGATDIYKISILDDGDFGVRFGKPENLGATINTSGREMYPYESQSKFYFSSDGHLSLGSLDVFETSKDENEAFLEPVNLGAPLNSRLDDFGFIIDEDTQTGYFSSNREGGKGDDDIYSFVRDKVASVKPCTQIANGTVINKRNKKPIANATVKLFNKDNELLETVYSDANGAFLFKKSLRCKRPYIANASKVKHGEDSEKFVTSAELGLELGLSIELDPIIELVYMDKGQKKFKIDNLNFDLNKHNIRQDAAVKLNELIAVMTEYPSIYIKIESHTDSRSSDAYNEKLSGRRAKSTRSYLISKGIDPNRIESAIGYGEQRLLNDCVNGVKCSNDKHDINRRSDFIITKM